MMSRRVVVALAFLFLAGACVCSQALAQTPGVLYTWDQSFGEAVGANNEGWTKGFGANTLTLDNTTDGTLAVTESGSGLDAMMNPLAGSDWAISDSFNRIKESFNPKDYGGIDLTGLSSLQLDIGHSDPTNTINGQVFAQVGPGSNFKVLGPISVLPGAVQTFTVPLTGLAGNEIDALRTIGIQVFGHTAVGNVNWKINEVRSVGTPLVTRRVADYPVGGPAGAPADATEGAIFNFDADTFVSGHAAGQNNSGMGFNSVDGALTWSEVPVNGTAPGAAVTWGSGNGVGFYPPTEFAARPNDFSNYKFARIRLRVASSVANEDVDVQFYTQGAGFAYHTGGPDQHIAADGQYHTLLFPLASIGDLAETQFHGINLGSHAGTWAVRVDFLEYSSVPEPASVALLGLGGLGALGLIRRKRS